VADQSAVAVSLIDRIAFILFNADEVALDELATESKTIEL